MMILIQTLESVTSAFPIWIKNTGSDKIFSVKLLASDGIISVEGGTKSTTDDAYIELALDNNSNLPNAQSVSPSTFTGASSSEDSPEILITNAVTTSNIGKSITELSADDDARTLMPNEYAIVWIRGHIRDITAPGGALPTSAGIKNIRFTVNAKTLGV
jgi:hypothetical protein